LGIAIFEFHCAVLVMAIKIGACCFCAEDYYDGEVTLLCALLCGDMLLLLLLIACGLMPMMNVASVGPCAW
jgi:hypothetical protein